MSYARIGVGNGLKYVREFPSGRGVWLYEGIALARIRQGTATDVPADEIPGAERAVSKRILEVAMKPAFAIVKFFRPNPSQRV